jgi:hypothetical protein
VPEKQDTQKKEKRTIVTTSSAKSSIRIYCNGFHHIIVENSKRKDNDHGGSR